MGQSNTNKRALLSHGGRMKINGRRSTNDWSGTVQGIIAGAAFGALMCFWGCHKEERVPPAPAEAEVFASPEAAGDAVYNAAKHNDSNAMLAIFGPNAKDVVFSGDPVQDKNGMGHFAANYEEMHRWGRLEKGMLVLDFGAENYPFPFPLRRLEQGKWQFDVDAGAKELVARRVGRNELRAISTLYAMADAQEQYFAMKHGGAKENQFAVKFVSTEGQRDGLYWTVKEGEQESPLGPLAADAAAEGYTEKKAQSFHGYYFRILKEQGAHAPGGAKSYLVNGKMTKGYAFLAWPAEYRTSGVMTFMIDRDGVVYQKDLGPQTADTAKAITAFDPDESWQRVDEAD